VKELTKINLIKGDCVNPIKNEIKIMYSLSHPNIVKLYNHFEDNYKIYLLLEYISGVKAIWKVD